MIVALWLTAVLLLGASLLLAALARRRAADAETRWPKVRGRIVDCNVRENGNGTYSPQISYVYDVDGKAYASDRLRPGGTPFFYSMGKAAAVAALYPGGADITVHHHPGKLGRAALECVPLSHSVVALRLLAGAAFAVAALVTMLP